MPNRASLKKHQRLRAPAGHERRAQPNRHALSSSGEHVGFAACATFLARNADKKVMITRVVLRPRIVFAHDTQPSAEILDALHHEAHDKCFIASSVLTEIVIETR